MEENILTIGQNQQNNRLWRIGIQNPKLARGNNLALLSIQDQSVTSGIYERNLKANGKVYHHIFDRNTGYPIDNQLASLTIVSDKSVDGEIWTTRLFGDSPSSILEKVEQENGIEAFVITEDNQIFIHLVLPQKLYPKSRKEPTMLKLIAIVGTNSKRSTNRQLLQYMSKHFADKAEIELVEIKDIPMFNKPC